MLWLFGKTQPLLIHLVIGLKLLAIHYQEASFLLDKHGSRVMLLIEEVIARVSFKLVLKVRLVSTYRYKVSPAGDLIKWTNHC